MDLNAIFFGLISGNYLFTAALWKWVHKLHFNHYKHLEARVTKLELDARDPKP